MANHTNPYQNSAGVSDYEIVRQLRSMIAEEIEAANLYEQLADIVDDQTLKNAILDIADEEKVHAGEFAGMVDYMQQKGRVYEDDDRAYVEDGIEEVQENL